MLREQDVNLARRAVSLGFCSEEQALLAIEDLRSIDSCGGIAVLLAGRGLLTPEQVAVLEAPSPPPPADDVEWLLWDLPDDEAAMPVAVAVCAQCGARAESADPASPAARIVFGQAFCLKCLDAAKAKAEEAGKDLDSKRTRAPSIQKKKPAGAADEGLTGIAELAMKFSGDVEVLPKPPPPLPKRISISKDLTRDDVREIERLLGKDREDLAVEHTRKAASCTEEEARRALELFALERPVAGEKKGIFGFARALGQSTRFYMNIALRKWEKIVEDGESFLESDPENIYLLTTIGEACSETGNFERAEELLAKAVEAGGGTGVAFSLLGELYFRLGRWKEALQIFEELHRRSPGDVAALERIRDCSMNAGDMERAAGSLAALAAADPARAREHSMARIELLYRLRRFQTALSELSEYFERDDPPYDASLAMALRLLDAKPQSPAAMSLAARMHAKRREWERALCLYEECLERKPDSLKSLRKCASVSDKGGMLGKAIWYLNLVLEHDPGDVDARRRLAGLLTGAGELDEAIEHLAALRVHSPGDADAAVKLAGCLLARGRSREARDAAETLPEGADPTLKAGTAAAVAESEILGCIRSMAGPSPDPGILSRLAGAFEARGLADAAAALFMQGADAGGDSEAAADRVAGIIGRLSNPGEAILFLDSHPCAAVPPSRVLDLFAASRGRMRPDSTINRLMLKRLVEARRFDDALSFAAGLVPYGNIYAEDLLVAFEEMQKAGVPDPKISLYCGQIHRSEGEFWKASKHLRDYLAQVPGDADAMECLIDVLRKIQDHPGTVEWIEKYSKIKTAPTALSIESAECLVKAGDLAAARIKVSEVINRDPANVHAKDLAAEIDARISGMRIAEIMGQIAQNPDDASARLELGDLYFGKGDFEMAARAYAGLGKSGGISRDAGERIFECNLKLGRRKRALMCLEDIRTEHRLDAATEEGRAHLLRMASLFINLNMPRKAGKLLFDIMKVDPAFRDAREKMSLVEILEELGEEGRTGAKEWYMEADGSVAGPFSIAEMKRMVDDHVISEDSLVWRGDYSNWKRAGQADKIRLLFELARSGAGQEDAAPLDAGEI